MFIHHYPGGVDTGLFKKAWGGKWWFWLLVGPMLGVFGTAPEVAAEKVLFLITSARYGGRDGELFLVNDKMKELGQERVLRELEGMDAGRLFGGRRWRRFSLMFKGYW